MAVQYNDTVEVKGKAGRIVIDAADLEAKLAEGYELVKGSEKAGAAPGTDGEGNVAVGGDTPPPPAELTLTRADVSKMKSAELTELVESNSLAVDLDSISKIGDKRDAVADALGFVDDAE